MGDGEMGVGWVGGWVAALSLHRWMFNHIMFNIAMLKHNTFNIAMLKHNMLIIEPDDDPVQRRPCTDDES